MTTIVGIRSKDGVVLASDRRASKGFFIGSKITQKISKVDDTLAMAIAGQLSDAEYMVKMAKAERKLVELRRGYPLSVRESARLIANLAYSGLKSYTPYFVELLVAGVDSNGSHVYSADMSGAVTEEDFASSGSGSPIAYGVLESGYNLNITLDEAQTLASKAVAAAIERDARIMRRAVFDRTGFRLLLAALQLRPPVPVSVAALQDVRRQIAQATHARQRDLDDAIYLACALDGNAQVLTSNDATLLGLGSPYAGVRIVPWREFVVELHRRALLSPEPDTHPT